MAKMNVTVRGAYDENYNSDDHATKITTPSLTKQSFAAECDINNVVSRWQKSGMPPINTFTSEQGSFEDVSEVTDYHTAMNVVTDAQRRFNALPSNVRDRFQNDPARFLDFMHDPKNTDEAISLGLATKRVEAAAEQPQELSAAAASKPPEAAPTAATAPQ